MQFTESYLTDVSGDYYSVNGGVTPNPSAGVCSWQTSGECNWPIPVSNTLTAVDDLWHAAVNGGGTYFSASDPSNLYTGLASAIRALDGVIGAAAAATTSNPNVTAGDNQVFVSNFVSSEWSGELESQRLNIDSGVVDASSADWSARDLLDTKSSRNIYVFSSGASNKLKDFSWASLNGTEQGYFNLSYITSHAPALTQFCTFGPYCLSATDQAAAAGSALVSFLQGDRSNEGDLTNPAKYFRQRAHKLGDIVNSESVYVTKPMRNYTDSGYAAFKASMASRPGTVYVGANDGMLHAFDATTGDELWAYMPTAVLPYLYQLADKQYATQHRYFVDATPTAQDVYVGGKWITMLVGGLGAGGRSYYALDITDPTAPKAMWEFTDTNLGLSFGKPVIGKLADDSWVVMFGSGYNNVSGGDGVGRLYVLNAETGAVVRTISTGTGDTGTPSGLAHIRGWVDSGNVDNTVQRVYGGDNLGNLWRFDVNNIIAPSGYDAVRLATLKAADGTAQPITSRPELGQVGSLAMVYVGTGRYLGTSDLTDASKQTIYAIKDTLGAVGIGDPRLPANKFVEQVLVNSTCPTGSTACSTGDIVRVTSAPKSVNFADNGGCFVDLPETRERVTTDPQLALGTLVVNSNVITSGDVCKVGGSSWANFFDYRTCAPPTTAKGVASVSLGNAVATRPALVKLPNGRVISVTRLSDNRTKTNTVPINADAKTTQRLSWRDLIQQ